MEINTANKQHIHDALIIDMKKRLSKHYEYYGFINGKPYVNALELMCDNILLTNTLSDINELVIEYSELFELDGNNDVCTLDGTLNYVLSLTLGYLVVN